MDPLIGVFSGVPCACRLVIMSFAFGAGLFSNRLDYRLWSFGWRLEGGGEDSHKACNLFDN